MLVAAYAVFALSVFLARNVDRCVAHAAGVCRRLPGLALLLRIKEICHMRGTDLWSCLCAATANRKQKPTRTRDAFRGISTGMLSSCMHFAILAHLWPSLWSHFHNSISSVSCCNDPHAHCSLARLRSRRISNRATSSCLRHLWRCWQFLRQYRECVVYWYSI